MNWVTSDGGPLILLVEHLLKFWGGVENKDYDRACEIDDPVWFINVNGERGIIFGDENFQTTFLIHGQLGPLFIRWVAAPSENAVLETVSNLGSEIGTWTWLSEEYVSKAEPHVLFDTAVSGSKLFRNEPFIQCQLKKDTYKIGTQSIDRPGISLVLHWFKSL